MPRGLWVNEFVGTSLRLTSMLLEIMNSEDNLVVWLIHIFFNFIVFFYLDKVAWCQLFLLWLYFIELMEDLFERWLVMEEVQLVWLVSFLKEFDYCVHLLSFIFGEYLGFHFLNIQDMGTSWFPVWGKSWVFEAALQKKFKISAYRLLTFLTIQILILRDCSAEFSV